MKTLTILLLLVVQVAAFSQSELGVALALGNREGTFSLAYIKDWRIGKSDNFAIGVGLRSTFYAGSGQYYTTAPARLTSGKTGLLVIFSPDIAENIDSVKIGSPQVNSLNVLINMGYKFHKKFMAGFNIDVIGFSFGMNKNSRYQNGSQTTPTQSKPSTFNVLLTSDNDLGSLNSEFYVKYLLDNSWAIKLAAQFHFTEYITENKVQQFPEPNDRFRNKSLMGAVGVTYRFQ